MEKSLIRKSKLLSLVLRHDPGSIGIELDANGWVEVDVLLAAIAERRPAASISRELLEEIVETNDKRRFAFSDDRRRIRASQGHSVQIELGLEAIEPPDILYHGTATRFIDAIMAEGLDPRGRQHVHLSADQETARTVGARHGKVVVLEVDCRAMRAGSAEFFLSQNEVWLTAKVAPEFLKEIGVG